MSTIEKFLHQHFASLSEEGQRPVASSSRDEAVMLADADLNTLEAPFARVNTVAPGGPADAAGLKPGDEIRSFGYVNRNNHDGLKKVAECVQGNEGVRSSCQSSRNTWLTSAQNNIFIRVSRPDGATQRQELRLTLVPRKDWGGRGMLGCHILPL
jgi:26S proteasome non-ATPase regulatory subunit 9